MNEPIVLEFQFKGLDQLAGGMKPAVDAMNRMSANLLRVNDTLDKLSTRSANTAAAISKIGSSAKRATGLLGQLKKASDDLYKALQSGDPDAIFTARVNLRRKQNAVQRGNNLINPPDPYQDMLNTSRVAIGPNGQMQIMPILSKLIRAGGSGNLLNFAGAGIGAAGDLAAGSALAGPAMLAGAAILALGDAAKAAAERMMTVGQLSHMGGSAADANKAFGALSGLGAGPDAINSAYASDSTPEGAYYDRKAGISPYHNKYGMGNQNRVKMFTDKLNYILNTGNEDDARNAAAAWNMENFLPYRDLSPDKKRALMNGMNAGPMTNQQGADLNYDLNRASSYWDSVKTNVAYAGATVAGLAGRGISAALDWVQSIAQVPPGAIPGAGGGFPGAKQAAEAEAIKNHTQAMREHTDALNRSTEATNKITAVGNGTYGGGQAARGLAMGYAQWLVQDRSATKQAIAMGAFSL